MPTLMQIIQSVLDQKSTWCPEIWSTPLLIETLFCFTCKTAAFSTHIHLLWKFFFYKTTLVVFGIKECNPKLFYMHVHRPFY